MKSNISVFANGKVMLRCNARSHEALYMKWYHRNKELSKLKNGKVLLEQKAITYFTSKLILEGSSLREGVYTCFVFNQYGTDRKSIYVRVKPGKSNHPRLRLSLFNSRELRLKRSVIVKLLSTVKLS